MTFADVTEAADTAVAIVDRWIDDEFRRRGEVHVSLDMRERLANIIRHELAVTTAERLWAEGDAYRQRVLVDELRQTIKIKEAQWFEQCDRIESLERDLKAATCSHANWHDTHHAGRLCDDCDTELDPDAMPQGPNTCNCLDDPTMFHHRPTCPRHIP